MPIKESACKGLRGITSPLSVVNLETFWTIKRNVFAPIGVYEQLITNHASTIVNLPARRKTSSKKYFKFIKNDDSKNPSTLRLLQLQSAPYREKCSGYCREWLLLFLASYTEQKLQFNNNEILKMWIGLSRWQILILTVSSRAWIPDPFRTFIQFDFTVFPSHSAPVM